MCYPSSPEPVTLGSRSFTRNYLLELSALTTEIINFLEGGDDPGGSSDDDGEEVPATQVPPGDHGGSL